LIGAGLQQSTQSLISETVKAGQKTPRVAATARGHGTLNAIVLLAPSYSGMRLEI
jgi:hypothetical protein